MNNITIELTEEETTMVYLAVCSVMRKNTNLEAVKNLGNIRAKLESFVDEATRIAGIIVSGVN